MRVEITGRRINVTDGIRAMVEEKLVRLERLLNNSALSAQLVFAHDKTAHRVDITVHARDEKFLHGVGKGVGWKAAVNQAVDKIVQQAQTVKGKYQARKRQSVRLKSSRSEAADAVSLPKPRTAHARMPAILRESRQTVQSMTVVAAMRQLKANGGVVIFRDAETAAVAVLCRDASGDVLLVKTDA